MSGLIMAQRFKIGDPEHDLEATIQELLAELGN